MKQTLRKTLALKALMLVTMLVGAINGVWADGVTYTFTTKSWTATLLDGTTANWISGKDGAGYSNNGIQVTSAATGANGTSPVEYSNITKIVVTYNTNTSKGAGSIIAQIGNNTPTTNNVAYSTGNGTTAYYTTEFTYDTPQSGAVKLTVNTTTNSIYLVSVAITYGGGDTPTLEESDLTLTGATALTFDLYDNKEAQVINYTTSSTGEVTVASNNYVNAVVDEENKTITVTPVSETNDEVELTVSQAADEKYKAGSATFTVTITDSTPIPTHTATFSINGTTSSQVFEEGADIVFPENPNDVNGKKFVGWVTEAISGVTDEKPTFVTSATMSESDVTYYAVFASVVGDATNVTDELDREFTGITGTSYFDWSGKTATSGAVYAGNSAGGNTSIQLRSSNSNSGIVTTKSGGKATKITVEWNSTTTSGRTLTIYGSNSKYSSSANLYGTSAGTELGTIVYGQNTELIINSAFNSYIGIRSASGALYLDKISITWSTGSSTISGYCTTVAADTREEAGLAYTEEAITQEITANYTGQTLANPNQLDVTYTSSNEEVATVDEDGVLTILAVGETTITATFAGNDAYKAGRASYVLTIQDSREALELAFAAANVEVNVEAKVAAPALSGNTGNGAVTYTSDNTAVATVDAITGEVTGVADGTATITATVAATNDYQGGTATFTVTVIDPNKKGTATNPYTVAEARAAIDAGTGVENVYATGIVSAIPTAYNTQYKNITFNIIDQEGDEVFLQAYRCGGDEAANVEVGDTVVVKGNLTKYGSTYEFGQGCQLITLTHPAIQTPVINAENVALAYDATEGEIAYTITHPADGVTLTAQTDADWISIITVGDDKVTFTATANEGETDRVAEITLSYTGAKSKTITITQAGFVADYATLPFEFNGIRDDISETSGLTQEGLGPDYAATNASTRLKFDNTGDALVLKLADDANPYKLIFSIKGNSFSGGTFSVQTSNDGETYTTLKNYTELEGSVKKEVLSLSNEVRYIKWFYDEKSSGNVGLGDIRVIDAVDYTRSSATGNYGTICLPHDAVVNGAELYSISGKGSNWISLSKEDVLEAGVPYIFMATADAQEFIYTSNVKGSPSEEGVNGLIGSLTGTDVDENMYIIYNNEVCLCGTGCSIAANRAYIDLSKVTNAEVKPDNVEGAVKLFFNGAATAINSVNAAQNAGEAYDLTGRRVKAVKGGLYIVNGKKIVK